jgi:BirA family transcriptional regulator, biotin operon repressor / biotin---[acetyl-CoA-carboxylase] ligase
MTWIGRQRFTLASCPSTSDEAARLARAGAVHGTLVIADEQTHGRGRLGRPWASPRGNVYMSAVLRLPLPPADVPAVTLAIGIAVCDVARRFGARVGLKWPNDVVVADAESGAIRKLAGILVESQCHGGRVDAVIAGIGVNLRGPVDPAIANRAVSLSELLADDQVVPDRDAFVDALLPVLETWIDRYVAGGAAIVVPAWEARMCVGLRVRVPSSSAFGAIEGDALGLEPDGALCVRDDTGVIHRIRSGEAEAVHP